MRVGGSDWLYAIGDVNGRALLTHMGKYQARDRRGHDPRQGRRRDRRRRALAARDLHRPAGGGGRAHAGSALRRPASNVRAVDVPDLSRPPGASFYGRDDAPGHRRGWSWTRTAA